MGAQWEYSGANESILGGERETRQVTVRWVTVGLITVLKNNFTIIKFQYA